MSGHFCPPTSSTGQRSHSDLAKMLTNEKRIVPEIVRCDLHRQFQLAADHALARLQYACFVKSGKHATLHHGYVHRPAARY